jgi:hypothetical protein
MHRPPVASGTTPHLVCWADLLQLLQVLLAQHHAHAANVLLKVPAVVTQQQARQHLSITPLPKALDHL